MTMTYLLAPLALLLAAHDNSSGEDWVIQSGTVRTYHTAAGTLWLNSLRIEAGGTLRVVGRTPFRLLVSQIVVIDGSLDLSGKNNFGVTTLNTTNQPEPGARGQAGGGDGGVGSAETIQSTPAGGPGEGPGGGGGGETSYSDQGTNARRGAGGGGGVLAADQPVHPDPLDPSNRGLVAWRGWPGGALGLGALSQNAPAQGGSVGSPTFVDGNPANDFWGVSAAGVVGELATPRAGSGGGAGGDAVDSASFPLIPFLPSGDEKGSGGGGGGGLGLVLTRELRVGPRGRIRVDGGHGGGGENVGFFDRVGGGSAGGSGGMLVLEAVVFDFSRARDAGITALGGRGGPGKDNHHDTRGAGGNGGPGILQLHTPDGTQGAIRLPVGKTLEDLTSPDAVVLLPILGG